VQSGEFDSEGIRQKNEKRALNGELICSIEIPACLAEAQQSREAQSLRNGVGTINVEKKRAIVS
jgi:hypothetical protein